MQYNAQLLQTHFQYVHDNNTTHKHMYIICRGGSFGKGGWGDVAVWACIDNIYLLLLLHTVYFSCLFSNFFIKPSWTLYLQVMTFEQAEKFRLNPFDLTKVCAAVSCTCTKLCVLCLSSTLLLLIGYILCTVKVQCSIPHSTNQGVATLRVSADSCG